MLTFFKSNNYFKQSILIALAIITPSISMQAQFSCNLEAISSTGNINAQVMAYSTARNYLAVARSASDLDNFIGIYTINSQEELELESTSESFTTNPASITTSADGNFIILGDQNNLRLFAVGANFELNLVDTMLTNSTIFAIDVTQDGCIAASTDLQVQFYTIVGNSLVQQGTTIDSPGSIINSIKFSLDGSYLFVAFSNDANNIGVYSINNCQPTLPAQNFFTAGIFPYALDISPDGSCLAATNTGSNDISIFTIEVNGNLVKVEGPNANDNWDAGNAPQSIKFSPDNQCLNVANAADDSLSIFTRPSESCTIDPLTTLNNVGRSTVEDAIAFLANPYFAKISSQFADPSFGDIQLFKRVGGIVTTPIVVTDVQYTEINVPAAFITGTGTPNEEIALRNSNQTTIQTIPVTSGGLFNTTISIAGTISIGDNEFSLCYQMPDNNCEPGSTVGIGINYTQSQIVNQQANFETIQVDMTGMGSPNTQISVLASAFTLEPLAQQVVATTQTDASGNYSVSFELPMQANGQQVENYNIQAVKSNSLTRQIPIDQQFNIGNIIRLVVEQDNQRRSALVEAIRNKYCLVQ